MVQHCFSVVASVEDEGDDELGVPQVGAPQQELVIVHQNRLVLVYGVVSVELVEVGGRLLVLQLALSFEVPVFVHPTLNLLQSIKSPSTLVCV